MHHMHQSVIGPVELEAKTWFLDQKNMYLMYYSPGN